MSQHYIINRLNLIGLVKNLRSALLQTQPSSYRIPLNFSTSTLVATKDESKNVVPDAAAALSLTPSCVKKLKEIRSETEPYLRINVSGGGCSGFQYSFDMDSKLEPDDKLICEPGGTPLVVVDSTSLSYIAGSTVDYYEELIRNGFKIVSNPQADGGCSCGASFSIKI